MDKARISAIRQRYEHELLEVVIPFWMRHSLDRVNGGFFNCLDRDGTVYDTNKHMWLQGRQVWMLSKLCREVEPRREWLEAAASGIDFLRNKALQTDGRVAFSTTAEGEAIYVQRKIFSECFFVMALSEYSRAAEKPTLMREAKAAFDRVWSWSQDARKVGRPVYPGEGSRQSLAVPMILLNLIEEISAGDVREYQAQVDDCIRRMLLHVHRPTSKVYETVSPEGALLPGPEGRLLNPGHAIEAGWFLQHWAQRLGRKDLQQTALDMVRWSFEEGWDKQYGGIFYFLDAGGHSPTQLEWSMKLWWPHCEAMYAHLLNYSITREQADWDAFALVDDYAWRRFRDPEFGEWFGYLDRRGEVTHRFKGGPYKGCFHVPRALWLCWRLLKRMEGES